MIIYQHTVLNQLKLNKTNHKLCYVELTDKMKCFYKMYVQTFISDSRGAF